MLKRLRILDERLLEARYFHRRELVRVHVMSEHFAVPQITIHIVFLNLFDPLIRRLAGVPVRDAESYRDELEQEINTMDELLADCKASLAVFTTEKDQTPSAKSTATAPAEPVEAKV
ncbi:MAG: hypothetical protein IH969_03110 [Candidatus Krumholzibacteriota bacterium]|nr:hypothetical protein [Candidatus Krumholzibacteriota bacterium]